MAGNEWWISQLPRVLMATVAILVELVFLVAKSSGGVEHLKDRIVIQVVLWMSTSLLSTTADVTKVDPSQSVFEAFLHVMYFANIMVAMISSRLNLATRMCLSSPSRINAEGAIRRYSAFEMCCPRLKERWHTNESMTNDSNRHTPAGLPWTILPFSLWVSTVTAYLEHGRINATPIDLLYRYLRVTGAVILICSVTSWWIHQYRARAERKRQYLPTTTPPNPSMREEHKWHQWTTLQVSAWLSGALVGISTEYISHLSSRLVDEGIDGPALAYIDIHALHSMGIPYGISCRFVDAVARLERKYPQIDQRQSSFEGRSGMNKAHIRPSPVFEHDSLSEPFASNDRSTSQHRHAYLLDEEVAKAQDSMMQRFGFHLPELRKGNAEGSGPGGNEPNLNPLDSSSTTIDDASLATAEDVKIANEEAMSTQLQHPDRGATTTPPQRSANLPATDIPEEILQTLPANVREVAKRNPHLFLSMLKAKQQHIQPQNGMLFDSAGKPKLLADEKSVGEQEEPEDEMAQLIPKHQSGPSEASLRPRPGF